MKSKIKIYILCAFFVVVAIFSIYKVWSISNEYKNNKKIYNELKEYVNINSNENTKTDEEVKNSFPTVDFSSLKKINTDIISWIYIEDTNINYPVVQGKDNDYYLNHLFNGNTGSSGTIFLDYRNSNDFSDRHTIIYGHNMKDGSMFADLNNYKEQHYFDEHPYYLLVSPNKNYKIDIISGYVASVNDNSWKIDFYNDDEFKEWINESKLKSLFESNIIVNNYDKIITLSTCSYEFDNARFVLVGVLREC